MSTTKLIIALLVATTLTIIGPIAFGKTAEASSKAVTFDVKFLDLSGVMTINDEKVADYSVYLFEDGLPLDTFQVNNRLEQHYMLPIGHNYALKFTKHGYKDRIMLVNTMLDGKSQNEDYTFRYSIEFLALDESNTFDDFPVAFISYDAAKKDFDYNRDYHKNVRTDNHQPKQTEVSKSWH